jgi:hypothetical protein
MALPDEIFHTSSKVVNERYFIPFCVRPYARALALVLSILLAVIWIQSAIAHTSNPYFFLSSVYKYKLTGPSVGRYVSILLPSLQFVLAICLLARVFVRGALLTTGILLTVFACIQVSALVRGIKIDCGCFGPANSTPIGQSSVAIVISLSFCAYVALAASVYGSNSDARF